MEGDEEPSAAGQSPVDQEEVRRHRLAYFQTPSPETTPPGMTSSKAKFDRQGTSRRSSDSISGKKEKSAVTAKTAHFHVSLSTNKEDGSFRQNSITENYISYTTSKLPQSTPNSSDSINTESCREKRRSSISSITSDDVLPVTNQSVKVLHSRSDVNLTPAVSDNTPHFANHHRTDNDQSRWASSTNMKAGEGMRKPVRKSGDREVERLFSTRKSTSASEIPSLTLADSVDTDSMSVFRSRGDVEDLGLATHRPESSVSSSGQEGGRMMGQRSMSSESLLLGNKAEEIRSLLGEEKYREFVEKSEQELGQLYKALDSPGASLNWSNGSALSERMSRADGSTARNVPTPPPQPPSPQPSGSSVRGPSPRRRLRSSSPQMVSRTLQDIARTREAREGGSSRNYEQVVIPHNVTFSADEIYRQAYGGDSSSRSDVRKSSSSMGTSFQDAGSSFWNSMTPRQTAGGLSPTSPHTTPMFQPHFMPVSVGGGPMHPPAPPPPMSVGSPGTYFYPPGGVAVSMAGGGGGGQFSYSRQPNMMVPVSPGTTPPQSPEAYFYPLPHPLSQSIPTYPPPSSPMQSPGGVLWPYGQAGRGQDLQGVGHQTSSSAWSQFAPHLPPPSQQYGAGWHHSPPAAFLQHAPAGVGNKGGGHLDSSKGARSSSAEHADAVRLYHQQQRQEQEKKAYSRTSSQAASGDNVERYFSSLGMSPPNYPPPPYHILHPPSSQQAPTQVPSHHHAKHPHPNHPHPNHPRPNHPHPNHPRPNHPHPQVSRQSAEVAKSSDTMAVSHRDGNEDDDDDMTTVTRTSMVSGSTVKAGGVTERLQQIGVDPIVLHGIRQHPDVAAADEEALEAMRNMVRICPECAAVNKEYMTWCLHCGGVLIGVDPIPTKDLKKKNREKKGGSESKAKKTSSLAKTDGAVLAESKHENTQDSPGSNKKVPVRVLHQDSSGSNKKVPVRVLHQDSDDRSDLKARASVQAVKDSPQDAFLEFEEIVEEEVIYDQPEQELLEDVSESGETAQRTLPVVELNHDAVLREAATELRNNVSDGEGMHEQDNALEGVVEMKESPESGRGASASSSPCRRNIGQDPSEDIGEPSLNTLEVSDNKDSGRPSSGEGAESRKPLASSQLVPENGPRRSEKEINDICEVINDPIIRGFIKNYLQKKPQDPTPDLSQSLSNNHKERSLGKSSQRGSSEATNTSHKPVQKSFSLDLEAGVNSKSKSSSKSAPGKRGESPKRSVPKKGVKKGHEAIDVEIFALEEAKQLRSSQSGSSLVPRLKFLHSSDEEEDSSEKTSSVQGPASMPHGGSSDSSSPRGDATAPVNYSADIQTLAVRRDVPEHSIAPARSHSPEHARHHPNAELAHSNFQFLKGAVDSGHSTTSAGRGGKKGTQNRQHRRPGPASKVRASVEAPPSNRYWTRSSVAWSSYHPRELRTRSSLNVSSGFGGSGRPGSGHFRGSVSTDSLVGPAPPDMPPSQRPRPASADLHIRRGGQRGRPSSAGRGQRPYSAGMYSSPQVGGGARTAASGDHSSSQPPRPNLQDSSDNAAAVRPPSSPNVDIEGRPIHRLTVHEDTLPLIPAGPNTALKIYDRCFDKTPRAEEEQECKWLFLPDELWLHVFTYLPQLDLFHLMLTCKQLYRVALDPQLWKRVTVRKKSLRTEWLGEIARRHPVSLALVQCHGDNLSDGALRDLFREVAPKLKELNFSRCSKGKLIGDEILLHASTHCRHLTHVDASWCHVTDVGLTALAGCCHRLESLCLNGCQQITDDSLKTVVERHGTSLRVLELFGCFSLSPASFRHLAECCTFLLNLNMGQCYKISDSNMVTLSASLSRVETLDLRGCKKLGDNSIRKIVRSCRRLRYLTLANCPLLSNASIVEIATYSTDIRSLDICGCSNISDSSIQTLVNNCFRLTAIDISSTSCTHKSVLMLADASRYLESAKFNFLPDVHEKSLAKLLKNCKRLSTVHLYGCNVRDVTTLKRFNRFINIEM